MRCFFAAWPDESTRLALAALSDDVRGRVKHRRLIRADDLHLTLTFIGELADEEAFAIARAAEALRFQPFEWQLDQLGFFEPAGVVWAGADIDNETGKPLFELAEELRRIFETLNVDYDDRPLAPHVTLLRGVKQFTAERVAPIVWRIDSLALYRSTGSCTGARYSRVLR